MSAEPHQGDDFDKAMDEYFVRAFLDWPIGSGVQNRARAAANSLQHRAMKYLDPQTPPPHVSDPWPTAQEKPAL